MGSSLTEMLRKSGQRALAGAAGVMAALGLSALAAAEHAGVNDAANLTDSSLVSYAPEAPVSGRVTIAGSDTMQPLLTKLAIEFKRRHPDMKIAVQGSRNHQESTVQPLIQSFLDGLANSRRGDGKTSGHLGSNDVQLLASSRELTNEEVKQFTARHGYQPTAIPIAQDAVAVYVNRNNSLPGLTLEQLDAIFSTTRKRGREQDVLVWGQAGLQDEWQHAPIHLYGRDLRSRGTLPLFKQVVLLDGEFKPTVSLQPGSASVILAVSQDPMGIGYSGIGFQSSMVRVVPLAEKAGMPFISPSYASVTRKSYPMSRPLYLYVNKDPDKKLDTKILEFLKFANSREGQKTIAEAGVFPLTTTQVARNLSALTRDPLRAASISVSE